MSKRFIPLLLLVLFLSIPATATARDSSPIFSESGYAADIAAPDTSALQQSEPSLGGSSFLRDSLTDLLGDFTIQSQLIYILADDGKHEVLPSLLNATSSVANVFVGFRILSFHTMDEEQAATTPWNAYMGFSYGLRSERDGDDFPALGQSPHNQDNGGNFSTLFGVSVTF
ncbi:MAG: hypothetical protein V3573_12590 [Desulfovibrionaceae bacterium]